MPQPPSSESGVPLIQRVTAIAWPSFLVAGVATVVFFTLFDPLQLDSPVAAPVHGRLGGYSIGFFAFWALGALSSALTVYFLKPCPPTLPRPGTRP